jgi:hypothetical protein
VYEVNTAVWLGAVSQAAGRPVTLADVPGPEWDAITPAGIDAVWLMGVWERSPAGLALANANNELWASFERALPDLRAEDVIGSPYCVRRYVAAFGGPDALAVARAELAKRGVRLVLDYVPNHVAPDHPWVSEHPELFIRGDDSDLAADPASWLSINGHVLARGRDPYFPPWPDVVQLDAYSPAVRTATSRTLAGIADQCDGIRCDMAMLMINDIFGVTWDGQTGHAPGEEFWPAVITGLRGVHPETVLIAEAYWDQEWTLQRQGFAFCYDKRLYDRTVVTNAPAVREHLRADPDYQSRLMRFLENHDEPRISGVLPRAAARAAAVAVATVPGATLWHEGQFEGRRARPPVFLTRRPDEPRDAELSAWYRRLVAVVATDGLRNGTWHLLEPQGWPDNQTYRNLLAWSWAAADGTRHLVVINFSARPAQARIPLGWPDLAGRSWQLADLLDGQSFERDGDEIVQSGLFVTLQPWQFHVLRVY